MPMHISNLLHKLAKKKKNPNNLYFPTEKITKKSLFYEIF